MPKYTRHLRINKKKHTNHKKMKTKRGGYLWPFTSNASKEVADEVKVVDANVFLSDKIGFQSIPNNYKSIGILHITESSAINALREIGTSAVNIFGSKGFDNTVYDSLRKDIFDKVINTLKDKQKVYNIKLDFETNPQGSTIFLHLSGDLCEPKNNKDDSNDSDKDHEELKNNEEY